MELNDRQSAILALIRANGQVEVDRLARSYGVSPQTIRRDLAELCDRGLAARTHGGARQLASVGALAYTERRALAAPEKAAIARAAAALVPDGASVTLNIGTTTEQVARALAGHRDLTVLTNNVNIVTLLVGARLRELILVGGTVRLSDGAVVGADAVEFISRYKTDYAVIGASALDGDGAVLDHDGREVSVARAILRNARHRILVADRSKFARTAPVRICGLDELDTFVTDAPPPAEFAEAARAAGTEIILARTP